MEQSLQIGLWGQFTNLAFGICAIYVDLEVIQWPLEKGITFCLKKVGSARLQRLHFLGPLQLPASRLHGLKPQLQVLFQSRELEAIHTRFVQFTPFNDALEKERFIGPPSMHSTPWKFNIATENFTIPKGKDPLSFSQQTSRVPGRIFGWKQRALHGTGMSTTHPTYKVEKCSFSTNSGGDELCHFPGSSFPSIFSFPIYPILPQQFCVYLLGLVTWINISVKWIVTGGTAGSTGISIWAVFHTPWLPSTTLVG